MIDQNPLQQLINTVLRHKPILYIVFLGFVILLVVRFCKETGAPLAEAWETIDGAFDNGTKYERMKKREIDRIFKDKFMVKYLHYMSSVTPSNDFIINIGEPASKEAGQYGGYYNAPFEIVQKAIELHATMQLKFSVIEPFDSLTNSIKENSIEYAMLNRKALSVQLDIIQSGTSSNRVNRRNDLRDGIRTNVIVGERLRNNFDVFIDKQMREIGEKYCKKTTKEITVKEKNKIAEYYKQKWVGAIVSEAGENYIKFLESEANKIPNELIWLRLRIN